MNFDPSNPVVKLCAEGIALETKNDHAGARALYRQAWQSATNDFEKFTAAHYMARQQGSIPAKLEWDLRALKHASRLADEGIQATYPSLYLNIAKGYEDMGDLGNARSNYMLAESFAGFLPENGYGYIIRGGIEAGLARIAEAEKKGNA